VTTGFYGLTPDRQSIINAGRIAINEPTQPNTVDRVDIQSGSVEIIWELASADYFPLQSELSRVLISADGSYSSFNIARTSSAGEEYYLAIIDWQGNLQALLANAISVSWSTLGVLTILQLPDVNKPGEVLLANWQPGDDSPLPIFGPDQVAVVEGIWSPDGQALALCTFDPGTQSLQIHTWQQGDREPNEVQSAPSPAGRLCNLAWLPDSSAFFFNLSYPNGTLTPFDLWKYQIGAREAIPVIRSAILP